MFDKVSQAAEQVATNVSRREFLGGVGRGAAVLAAMLGGLLATPGLAAAGKPCASNGDCPNKQICVGGRCVKGQGPRLCDASSVPECVGLGEGQTCGPFGYGTYCHSGPSCLCGTI
jgi:hypothetical protein